MTTYMCKLLWGGFIHVGPKSCMPGKEKSCAGIEKWVSEIFANFFRRILLDFRKIKSPTYIPIIKESEIKSLFLGNSFFLGGSRLI